MISQKTIRFKAPDTFENAYFFYESALCPHETGESAHRNRIFLKPLSRIEDVLDPTSLVNSCDRLKPDIFQVNYVINSGPGRPGLK